MTREPTRRRAAVQWFLLGVIATTLIACGSNDPDTGVAATTETTLDSAVPEALRFTAPLVGSGEFDGAAVAGRPVAFWFWAPT
jgi:hypothetical protein